MKTREGGSGNGRLYVSAEDAFDLNPEAISFPTRVIKVCRFTLRGFMFCLHQ